MAMEHHHAGHLKEAEAIYRAILQAQPQNPDVNHNLGILVLQLNQPQVALPYLQAALKIDPAQGQYWLSLTECQILLQAWEAAAMLLDEAEAKGLKHPTVPELRDRIAARRKDCGSVPTTGDTKLAPDLAPVDALREAGQWQQAADAARLLLKADPNRADAWALLALVLPQLQMLDEAGQAAQNALLLAPQNPSALRALAIVRLRQQKPDEAATLAERALAFVPNCPRTLMVLAGARMAQQRLDEAEALLARAISIEPLAEVHANYALLEMRRNNVQAAIRHAEIAVSKKPFLVNVWQLLVGLYQQTGHADATIFALEQMLQYAPDNAAALSDLGEYYRKTGRLNEALELLERAVTTSPAFMNAWINYGTALHDANRIAEAMAAYEKVLAFNPDQGEVHNNLGCLYKEEGEWEKALEAFESACRFQPDRVDIHANRGCALAQLGRIEEAEAVLAHAIKLDPDNTATHLGRSIIATQRNNWGEAEYWVRQALETKPTSPELWCHLGGMLVRADRGAEAEVAFARALSIRPDLVAALQGMATVLLAKGDTVQALEMSIRSLQIKETQEARNGFAQSIKQVQFIREHPDARRFAVRAISEAWTRPRELVGPVVSLIKLNRHIKECIERAAGAWPTRLPTEKLFGSLGLSATSGDGLLQSLLENTPVSDREFEKFLTMARFALLGAATHAAIADEVEEKLLTFYCSLARQCFISEYVFGYTDQEFEQALLLRERLETSLASNIHVPVLWLVSVAAYFPLSSLPSLDFLLDRPWPASVAALLTQQIREPLEERRYRTAIPSLTAVEDGVSLLVQQQYEENPYPRWVKSPVVGRAIGIDNALRGKFPLSPFVPLGKNNEVEVLIAGCGTGQHPMGMAPQFRGARVLAVDLSLASLCYAKRKTSEAGMENIEYAQADIMKLGAIDRTFDLIESLGVLHHLADPMAGWRELLTLLRPGGLMRLGFYSELARQDVVAAREFIARQNYAANAEDIRQFRQELITSGASMPFFGLTASPDFYSVSACRDLLFHVQEHRFTLPQIKGCLAELGLNFIGFTLESNVVNKYKERFPEDKAMTNLDCWNAFETENPSTFAGMYQFWVQKAVD